MMRKLFYFLWFFSITSLFLYSFTQVDLSLTLSQTGIIQNFQKSFQYVGYFNRPLSAFLFILLVLLLFLSYTFTLFAVLQKKLSRRDIWTVIIATTVLLAFSYNAFSYDIFNYIFDAKIITKYGDNPYVKKALDYPLDPMLSFMHWTHRTYPYGPTWLVATAPLTFIGKDFFLLTFFLFKFLAAGAFLGTVYVIEKIAELTKRKNVLFTLALFALNPLVLVESLVSAHNDVLMLFFAAAAILMYIERKLFLSIASLLISISIKYATFILVPAFIVYKFICREKENHDTMFAVFSLFLLLATIAATVRTQFQPWYLLYPLLTAVLLGRKVIVLCFIFILSFAALMQYVPYLYLGNWDPPVPFVLNAIMLAGIILLILSPIILKIFKIKNEI